MTPPPIIGRADKISTLQNLIRTQRELARVSSEFGTYVRGSYMHVWGPPSSGKSLSVALALENAMADFVKVDCAQVCQRPKRLFDALLFSIAEYLSSKPGVNFAPPPFSGASASDSGAQNFVKQLNCVLDKWKIDTGGDIFLVVVADMVERLAAVAPYGLTVLVKLGQWTAGRLCVVGVSRVTWLQLARCIDAPAHCIFAEITFEPYTKDELKEIIYNRLERGCGADENSTQLRTFCDILVDVCMVQATTSWQRVSSDIAAGLVDSGKKHLWTHCRKLFERAIDRLYWADLEEHDLASSQENSSQSCAKSAFADAEQLPSVSCLLVTAAYIASYNPKSTDRRFFAMSERTNKRIAARPLKPIAEQDKRHTRGAQPFEASRWQSIFFTLASQCSLEFSDKFVRSINVHPQMTTLVHSGLVGMASAPSNLSQPKFRCLASLEMVEPLAKSVDINLKQYLVDFND